MSTVFAMHENSSLNRPLYLYACVCWVASTHVFLHYMLSPWWQEAIGLLKVLGISPSQSASIYLKWMFQILWLNTFLFVLQQSDKGYQAGNVKEENKVKPAASTRPRIIISIPGMLKTHKWEIAPGWQQEWWDEWLSKNSTSILILYTSYNRTFFEAQHAKFTVFSWLNLYMLSASVLHIMLQLAKDFRNILSGIVSLQFHVLFCLLSLAGPVLLPVPASIADRVIMKFAFETTPHIPVHCQ